METIKKIENWYNTKDTFTIEEIEYINRLKDTCEIDALDIGDIIMTYIYDKLDALPINYDKEVIWDWDNKNLSNTLTSKENYLNLLNYLNEINMNNKIKYAENWFKLQDIPTIIQDDKIYISNGDFQFELSADEISYRAVCYLDSEKQGLLNN